MSPRVGSCRVCDTLNADDRLELDYLLADPRRWPREVLGRWQLPPGILPARYKAWGAVAVGMAWLAAHGRADIKRSAVFRHWRFDVPRIASSPEDMVAQGMPARTPRDLPEPSGVVDPRRYLAYYAKGIEVGIKGLDLLLTRIEALQHENKPVPENLMKLAIDAGQRLAVSQASLQRSGAMFHDDEAEDDSFLAAGREEGPRFAHHRIRVIDGEARPVADQGPADRATYDARARREGGAGLPHP